MDHEDYMRGNWAFLHLEKAYTLLLEYENSHLIDKGEIPRQESGPRLYKAAMEMAEVMKDRACFLDWADVKLAESPHEYLTFFDYRWACSGDVENTLMDISGRIFLGLAPNLDELLKIRQGVSAELALSEVRRALRLENKALWLNSGPAGRVLNFLMDVVFGLVCAWLQGEHRDGVLDRGVLERVRNGVAESFGLSESQARKIWAGNKEFLQGRVIRGSDGEKVVLRLEGGKIRLERA